MNILIKSNHSNFINKYKISKLSLIRIRFMSYKIQNKESILDINYTILHSFGYNPQDIINHSDLRLSNIT